MLLLHVCATFVHESTLDSSIPEVIVCYSTVAMTTMECCVIPLPMIPVRCSSFTRCCIQLNTWNTTPTRRLTAARCLKPVNSTTITDHCLNASHNMPNDVTVYRPAGINLIHDDSVLQAYFLLCVTFHVLHTTIAVNI